MQMPIIVGVILAIIALVVFSGWFYNMAIGWKEIVLDDVFFYYRIAGVSILSILIITATFFVMVFISGCADQSSQTLFGGWGCKEWDGLMSTANSFFKFGK